MSGSGYHYEDSPARGGAPVRPTQAYDAMQSPQHSGARRQMAPYARSPPNSYHDSDHGPYTSYQSHSRSSPERSQYATAQSGGDLGAPGNDNSFYGHQNYSHSQDPFSNSHAAESQHSMHSANSYGSYGHVQDSSMPGGRLPYRGDGYDEFMDPRNIADDGEDGVDLPQRRPKSKFAIPGVAAAGAGAGLGAFGNGDASGSYGPVAGGGGSAEKSEWLKGESTGTKKLRWIVIAVIALIIIGAIAGGVAYAVLHNESSSSSSSGRGSASDSDGLWDLDSSQVKAVLNNKNLHRVFPGMDYTPLNAQYPACLSNMPYQNDVTLDVAVLAQLTPAIRLYGTDCKQTEQVLKGIDLLGYNETVKVWLGVFLGDNSTTNTRQLNQMYDILDEYPSSHFAGVIVGNEVLWAQTLSEADLANQLTKVRQALSQRGMTLPVATADLGDNWTPALAADSDIIMANVHPFFAGVLPDEAAGWTWDFWDSHDVVLKSKSDGDWPANIISETGWPTEGGNDCGVAGEKCATKTAGAVAGIDELNTFMEGWVCPSMANSTTYFWFEAFDEPWKEQFNDPKTGDFWEPHWGLFDVNRNLKKGVKIPDCGGKTLSKPY